MFLTNIAASSRYMNWFDHDWQQVADFTEKHGLDGIELILHDQLNPNEMPQNLVQGLHLTYWPICLDFLRQDQQALLRQFQNEDNIKMYYGGLTPQCLIDHYRNELKVARELKVKYMVFHVSHVELSHIYNWKFTYHDREVLDAAADFINEVFQGEDQDISLLMENLWWPGLNFMDPEETERFFDKIHYRNKGFMLDIGHLMITNPELKNEMEAKEYILKKIKSLKGIKEHIKGIHINKALSGDYLKQNHSEKGEKLGQMENFWDRFMEARDHILKIDTHVPFDHLCIQEIVEYINPQYTVFEIVPNNLKELGDFINLQNNALGRI